MNRTTHFKQVTLESIKHLFQQPSQVEASSPPIKASVKQFELGDLMRGTESEPRRVSQYRVRVECPHCGAKMILHVGLTGDPKNNRLECIACHCEIESLVPGQIVGGPFAVTN